MRLRRVGAPSHSEAAANQGRIAAPPVPIAAAAVCHSLRGRVEDVVVDTAARGQGIAALLTSEALRIAREAGARTVDLT